MKKYLMMACWLLGAGVFAASCSSDDDVQQATEETGTIQLGVSTGTYFGVKTSTKAVNEEDYANVNNYTVQVLQNGVEKYSWTYADVPSSLELPNGSYTVKAYYGTEKISSRQGFYSVDEETITVQGNEQTVSLTCEPTCAKTVVKFSSDMATYFADYYVNYETEALVAQELVATWAKDDTEPWYLLVNKDGEAVKATIHLTPQSTYKTESASIVRTFTLKPNQAWTLNIAPAYEASTGQLGISITIDESTNDIPVDIEVPAEWI